MMRFARTTIGVAIATCAVAATAARAEREAGGRFAPQALVVAFSGDTVDEGVRNDVLAISGKAVAQGEIRLFVNKLAQPGSGKVLCLEFNQMSDLGKVQSELSAVLDGGDHTAAVHVAASCTDLVLKP